MEDALVILILILILILIPLSTNSHNSIALNNPRSYVSASSSSRR